MNEINPNQDPIDAYTAMHFLVGMVGHEFGLSFSQIIAASIAWEWVIEPYYKEVNPEIFPAPSQDSTINRVTDTLAMAGGWIVAKGGRRE